MAGSMSEAPLDVFREIMETKRSLETGDFMSMGEWKDRLEASGVVFEASASFSAPASTEVRVSDDDRLEFGGYEEPAIFINQWGGLTVRYSRRDLDDSLDWEDVTLEPEQIAKLRALLASVK
jgi:hypothetical protein